MFSAVEFLAPSWLWALLAATLALLVSCWFGAGRRDRRRWLSLVLRVAIIAGVCLALAGPLWPGNKPSKQVIFAIDRSASVGRAEIERADSFLRAALARQPDDATTAVVSFAAQADVERRFGQDAVGAPAPGSVYSRDASNIALGLETALGLFSPGGLRRIVLLSDGRETDGQAQESAALAQALGVEIDVLSLTDQSLGDKVYVDGIEAPSVVRADEPFRVEVNVQSAEPTDATLSLLRNGISIAHRPVLLERGHNQFRFVELAPRRGLVNYEAILSLGGDSVVENNRFQRFVRVAGASSVLHLYSDSVLAESLSNALEVQGIGVESRAPSELPSDFSQLALFDMVILNNVSSLALSASRMSLLQRYVRDAGGGLLVLGGPDSYGAGGYLDTPLEEMLPVSMDSRADVRIPTVALVVLIDRSGSMSGVSRGEEKLAIAKLAGLAAVEVLNPLDQVGLLAFDAEFEWVLPMIQAGNRNAIELALRKLSAGGGTNLFEALAAAATKLGEVSAKVKHLIVLSDGLTETEVDFDSLQQQLEGSDITISSVAFGTDADQDLLARIAQIGGGRYYHTLEPSNVPRIFTSETLLVARDLVVESPTRVELGYAGEMLQGIAVDNLPALLGYQRVFAKTGAQVLLRTADSDPILTSWRYGLGRSVAFASDLGARWGRDWIEATHYAQLVSQIARWTMRRRSSNAFNARILGEGHGARLVVDVVDGSDLFVNGLQLQAQLRSPAVDEQVLTLRQTKSGRYEAEFDASLPGRYLFAVGGGPDSPAIVPSVIGHAVSYASEYRREPPNTALMDSLARATGGRVLSWRDPAVSVYRAGQRASRAVEGRLWWPFILAALLAIPIELLLRRVDLIAVLGSIWRRYAKPRYGEMNAADLERGIAERREAVIQTRRARGDYADVDDPQARARSFLDSGSGS